MSDFFSGIDLDRSFRQYEFTLRTLKKIAGTLRSDTFRRADADAIFLYLLSELREYSFSDHLKRFVALKIGEGERWSEISGREYSRTIRESFDQRFAPYTFRQVMRKPSAIVKSWLTQENVHRETLFIIGFGLGMSDTEVSGFLKKVLLERDFDPASPEELVYRFCFKNDLPYETAHGLLSFYHSLPAPDPSGESVREAFRMDETGGDKGSVLRAPETDGDEAALRDRLVSLRASGVHERADRAAFDAFSELYGNVRAVIAEMFSADSHGERKRRYSAGEISASDVERVIYSGVPRSKNGNVYSLSGAVLSSRIGQHRLTRQRIESILDRSVRVVRKDLITLTFFADSQRYLDLQPEERYERYVADVNAVLSRCAMGDLYLVNPYEAFTALCMFTDTPFAVYSDVQEKSYNYYAQPLTSEYPD